jgi:SAM-dependent methyltransferase
MRRESVGYWDAIAASSEADARDAVLAGFRGKQAFDEAGRIDAHHLALPFLLGHERALDLGCGVGRILKWMAPACREAIAVDVSAEMLKRARANLAGVRNVRFRRLPITLEVPVPDRSINFCPLLSRFGAS